MSAYECPDEINYAQSHVRGTYFRIDFAGHDVQVYVTEKRKQVRIFVDGTEWKRGDE